MMQTTLVEAIKNLKIDKITVWDSGQGKTTGDFLTGLLGSVPALQEVFKMTGAELPNFLKGAQEEKPTLTLEDKSSDDK